MSLEEILKVYFTTPEGLIPFLQKTNKKVLISYLANILHSYATDVNSSSLRELFTLIQAEYQPTPGKLGYNGKSAEGRPVDVKPVNIRSDSGNKLNGGGNVSDFTYERLARFSSHKVIMLVSGFVDGQLVYILEFPFSSIEEEIRRQIDKRFPGGTRPPGEYLRSASFSFTHYKDTPGLRLVYKAPDLDKFE